MYAGEGPAVPRQGGRVPVPVLWKLMERTQTSEKEAAVSESLGWACGTAAEESYLGVSLPREGICTVPVSRAAGKVPCTESHQGVMEGSDTGHRKWV